MATLQRKQVSGSRTAESLLELAFGAVKLSAFPIAWPVACVVDDLRTGRFLARKRAQVALDDDVLTRLRHGLIGATLCEHEGGSIAGPDFDSLVALHMRDGSEVVVPSTRALLALLRDRGVTLRVETSVSGGLGLAWLLWIVASLAWFVAYNVFFR